MALTAHKMYGPKGCGALILDQDFEIEPLFYGGGQQNSLRPGTLNVPGIVGLGEACRLRLLEMEQDETDITRKRDMLQKNLQAAIPELMVNGDLSHRLSGNLHISIPGILNSAMIAHLRPHLAISTGAACSSGLVEPSHVLQALRMSEAAMDGALRISLGKFTNAEDIEQASQYIIRAYQAIKRIIS